jgi:predicted SnoaL-like aldol condensation-catalyzing enzyme
VGVVVRSRHHDSRRGIREGELYVAELSMHATGAGSGVELDLTMFQIVRLAEGRGIEVWDYLDREQAVEAARHLV